MNVKIRYIDSYEQVLFEEYESQHIPRIGDMVWFDEVFFVKDIVWYPKLHTVNIYISETKSSNTVKVAESAEPNVKLEHVSRIKDTADKALKETAALKRQMFSVNQHIQSLTNKLGKNDTR